MTNLEESLPSVNDVQAPEPAVEPIQSIDLTQDHQTSQLHKKHQRLIDELEEIQASRMDESEFIADVR